MPAEPERLTYVLTIDCDHLGERTANAAYILTLKVSYDCRPAPQHVMSWHLGQIGRGAARVAGAPMTVAYGPADHAYEVAASAEGPVGRGGRSRPIASFGLFHAITGCGHIGLVLLKWFCRMASQGRVLLFGVTGGGFKAGIRSCHAVHAPETLPVLCMG